VLTALLTAAALAAGLAGGWSPCGLSMVETLAAGRSRVQRALGAWAFTGGALAGGLVTFGGLALVGGALAAGGPAWTVAAAFVLAVAALADGAGRRIVPQVRRQVPESWRRRMPLPVASGLYGVLLGLGFTTFVLSFATYGLAVAAFALGDPGLGIAMGAAFAAGRAIPVVAVAPWPDSALAAAMAERPVVLRGLRTAAATSLAAAAAALAFGAAPARAADLFTSDGADPSAAAGVVAWQAADRTGLILRAGRVDRLPGGDPAVSPTLVTWHDATAITVAQRDTLAQVARFEVPGVYALALSDRWLAWSVDAENGQPAIRVADLAAPTAPPRTVATGRGIGRPSIDGDHLVFHVVGRQSSRILEVDLPSGTRRVLRADRTGGVLLNPSVSGERLLYVRATAVRQQVRAGARAPRGVRSDRVAYSTFPTTRRDAGHEPGLGLHHQGYPGGRRPPEPKRTPRGLTVTLWTTALDGSTAYVTQLRHLRGGTTRASLLRVRA
jgi:MFS family permease